MPEILEPPDCLRRSVSVHLELDVVDAADLALSVAVAAGLERASEELTVRVASADHPVEEVEAAHDARVQLLTDLAPGRVTVDYRAEVVGAGPVPVATRLDWFEYLRPSRYCESDRMGALARDEFRGLAGADLVAAVTSWVGTHLAYVPGSSRPTDGAVATLLSREGVCRDFAHLTAALLRANGVPARIASVYAPGLHPMDFHAVTEAHLDGVWYVVDPTGLAPRTSMVRIATGADAADTAFLTTLRGIVDLVSIEVTAVIDPGLPVDDVGALAQLR